MLQPLRSDDVIEALVMLNCGESASAQAKHLYRESLRSLVRLAQTECRNALKYSMAIDMKAGRDGGTLH